MTVAAIIPALNEEGAIGATVSRIPRALVPVIIVVDGQSTDRTVEEATDAGATVIVESRRGYGRACLTGAETAQRLGADILLFTDGDGADAVEDAGRLLTPLQAGQADFVLADRSAGSRARGSMGWHQLAAGWAVGLAVGAATGQRYRDMCAYRAIRAEALAAMRMREMGYGWNLEMQVRAARAGLRVLEIPMPYRNRLAGRSKVAGNLRGTLRASKDILRTLAVSAFGPA